MLLCLVCNTHQTMGVSTAICLAYRLSLQFATVSACYPKPKLVRREEHDTENSGGGARAILLMIGHSSLDHAVILDLEFAPIFLAGFMSNRRPTFQSEVLPYHSFAATVHA